MNWLDYVFLSVLVISTGLGAAKGLARVVVGLAAAVLGVLFAARWYGEAGSFLRDFTSSAAIANGLGFLLVLVIFLLLGGAVAAILARVFDWAGIGWLDGFLGAVFGAIRGVLICIALATAAMSFPHHTLPKTFERSRLAPYVAGASEALAVVTPPELRESIRRNYEDVRRAWSEATGDAPRYLPRTEL